MLKYFKKVDENVFLKIMRGGAHTHEKKSDFQPNMHVRRTRRVDIIIVVWCAKQYGARTHIMTKIKAP